MDPVSLVRQNLQHLPGGGVRLLRPQVAGRVIEVLGLLHMRCCQKHQRCQRCESSQPPPGRPPLSEGRDAVPDQSRQRRRRHAHVGRPVEPVEGPHPRIYAGQEHRDPQRRVFPPDPCPDRERRHRRVLQHHLYAV